MTKRKNLSFISEHHKYDIQMQFIGIYVSDILIELYILELGDHIDNHISSHFKVGLEITLEAGSMALTFHQLGKYKAIRKLP